MACFSIMPVGKTSHKLGGRLQAETQTREPKSGLQVVAVIVNMEESACVLSVGGSLWRISDTNHSLELCDISWSLFTESQDLDQFSQASR